MLVKLTTCVGCICILCKWVDEIEPCLRRTSDSPFLGSAPSAHAAAAALVVWIAKIFIHSLKQLSFNIFRRLCECVCVWHDEAKNGS